MVTSSTKRIAAIESAMDDRHGTVELANALVIVDAHGCLSALVALAAYAQRLWASTEPAEPPKGQRVVRTWMMEFAKPRFAIPKRTSTNVS
jgi:beta-lactamase regulating signal transducer with metallopeptidase domain